MKKSVFVASLIVFFALFAFAQATGLFTLTLSEQDRVEDQALALTDYIAKLSPADQMKWQDEIVKMAAAHEKAALSQETAGDDVWMTNSGKVYHKATCHHVAGKTGLKQLSMQDAQSRGIKACKVCFK
jgi:cytochrome b involved in lipid metabolism